MINNWRWFISRTLRETIEDRKQIQKMLAAQRDLIKQKKIEELEQALADLDKLCLGPIDSEALEVGRENMLQAADAILIPYPDPKYRDWMEMFLVVAALVLAFRTFFFQPFKIPTGSMQPTLFGITQANLLDTRPVPHKGTMGQSTTLVGADGTSSSKVAILAGIGFAQTPVPGKAVRVANWFRGETWYHLKAGGHWKLISVSPPSKAGLTKPYGSTKLTFEDLDKPNSPNIERTVWYTWFDNPPYTISNHGSQQTIASLIRMPVNFDFKNMITKVEFNQGEDVFKFKVTTGDHLFVNRITYNFRNPRRGDIAVFIINIDDVTPDLQYHDVNLPGKDTFYIKRLVALGGEQVSIGEDRHLNINDHRLTSADRGFEFVYSHNANSVVENSVYSGHEPIRLFPENQQFLYKDKSGKIITHVPKNHFLMFGDNTENSQDSRYWGAIPKKNVMGVSSFVYWPPFSPRFGWSHR